MLNAENSFESVGRDWHATKRTGWEPRYAGFILKRMEADIFPKLGSRPINDISAPELLSVMRLIEKRGAGEMAHRALKLCGQVFMFGRANPANQEKFHTALERERAMPSATMDNNTDRIAMFP